MTRSVILLDFDNVFLGLWQLDGALAMRFAQTPMDWLPLLAERELAADRRRWLVARCYLNPAGWVESAGEPSGRLFLSRFRPGLVRAGFEVVDCPGLTRHGKNAADIRLVIDALDLLRHEGSFDEFVIASGDADFTPLLQRIRAHDRRTTIISPGQSASAYTSIADRLIGLDALDAIVRPEFHGAPADAAGADAETTGAQLSEYLRDRYIGAAGPLNLSTLSQDAARVFPQARETGWFGAGSFTNAIARAKLENLRMSQHLMWDEGRHAAPDASDKSGDVPTRPADAGIPAAILSLQRTIDLPRLASEQWMPIFEMLARYAAENVFSLTESTRWTRDRMAEDGVHVSRMAIGHVVRGTQFGGAALDHDPPPGARRIGEAFCANLFERARGAGIDLDGDGEATVRAWLGLPLCDQPGDEGTG